MALISCPECNHTVSDKAIRCPNCGFPLQEVLHQKAGDDSNPKTKEAFVLEEEQSATVDSSGEHAIAEQAKNTPIKQEKRKFVVIGTFLLLCGIGFGVWYVSCSNNLNVNRIEITKWQLIEDGSYNDYYQGTITSDSEKPFVAVLGDYKDNENQPQLAYVEGGKGIFNDSVSDDEDPSTVIRPIGYISGQVVNDKSIRSVTQKDYDYIDFSFDSTTNCSVDLDIEFYSNMNGLFIFDVTNDVNNIIDRNAVATVINGKTIYSFRMSDLPYKSRGVELTIKPKFFCKCEDITSDDYSILKDYSAIKSNEYSFQIYRGEITYKYKSIAEGFILYTRELISGGPPEKQGKVHNLNGYIHKGEAKLSTYDSCDEDDDKLLKPVYQFDMKGVVKWNELP